MFGGHRNGWRLETGACGPLRILRDLASRVRVIASLAGDNGGWRLAVDADGGNLGQPPATKVKVKVCLGALTIIYFGP